VRPRGSSPATRRGALPPTSPSRRLLRTAGRVQADKVRQRFDAIAVLQKLTTSDLRRDQTSGLKAYGERPFAFDMLVSAPVAESFAHISCPSLRFCSSLGW